MRSIYGPCLLEFGGVCHFYKQEVLESKENWNSILVTQLLLFKLCSHGFS